MTLPSSFLIRPEQSGDQDKIAALQLQAFGPGALARAAFRVREQAQHDMALSFVGAVEADIVGSVRLTPIVAGRAGGLLLGPLVVAPRLKNRGIGRALMDQAVAAARAGEPATGDRFILLVGDEPYYRPAGFSAAQTSAVRLPGPVDPARLLALALVEGGIDTLSGMVRGVARRPADESSHLSDLEHEDHRD